MGSWVSHLGDHPIYIDQTSVRFPSVVQKSIIIFNQLHTTAVNESFNTKDHSRIQIQFQAILLNLGCTSIDILHLGWGLR